MYQDFISAHIKYLRLLWKQSIDIVSTNKAYSTDFSEEVVGIESAELACLPANEAACLPEVEVEDNKIEGAGIGAGAAGVGGEKTAKNTTKQK